MKYTPEKICYCPLCGTATSYDKRIDTVFKKMGKIIKIPLKNILKVVYKKP